MRDKLIELLLNSPPLHERDLDDDLADGEIEAVADYLIANNVFVLREQLQKVKQILTDIRDYLVAILDEWHRRIDEPNFYEQNIGVYNHIRKELDDLTEYAEKLGVEL